jgi:hypothetical protein
MIFNIVLGPRSLQSGANEFIGVDDARDSSLPLSRVVRTITANDASIATDDHIIIGPDIASRNGDLELHFGIYLWFAFQPNVNACGAKVIGLAIFLVCLAFDANR